MERIGVRELRQHASRYLARVKLGESVEVTERGHLIALIVPPAPAADDRERLVASGKLVPASRAFSLPDRLAVGPDVPSTGAVLDDLRADRA